MYDLNEFAKHLEENVEFQDLDLAQNQMEVVMSHILKFMKEQVDETVTSEREDVPHEMKSSVKAPKWSSLFPKVISQAYEGRKLFYIPPNTKDRFPTTILQNHEVAKASLI